MGWVLVSFLAVVGAGLLFAAHRRARRMSPLREAVPSRTIAELSAGRFRVTGRIVASRTTPSAIDESPCVFVECAEYRTVGSELVPLLKEVDRRAVGHPFHLEDGTGRLAVDPTAIVVDAVTLFEDGGLLAERRLRAGEEVELVASFRARDDEADGGPYRAAARVYEPVADECGPPRLGYRAQPELAIRPADDVTSFMRGVGVVLLLGSALAAGLVVA